MKEAESPERRLLLVDGHAQAYRAFHAIRRLVSPAGKPVNAVFGFIKMFERLRAWLKPSHLVVVWDGGLAPERLAILPEYKAQRPPMPADLAEQFDEMVAYLGAAGVASLCRPEVEADDWIATLAKDGLGWAGQVVIVSADKDFMQLVGERVGLVNANDKPPMIWTVDEVLKRTGVKPEQVVDWLSLIGDTVDNIPGVPGIGPKTATKLLSQFGSIASLYTRLLEVEPETVREKLRSAEGRLRRNQTMIRLKDDVRGDSGETACRPRAIEVERLRELYRKWGFKSLEQGLEAGKPAMRQTDLLL